jgi:hypothetical protein
LSDSNLETRVATPASVDEEATPAVHTANIPESTIAQQSFALAARDAQTSVEVGADMDVDVDVGLGGRF